MPWVTGRAVPVHLQSRGVSARRSQPGLDGAHSTPPAGPGHREAERGDPRLAQRRGGSCGGRPAGSDTGKCIRTRPAASVRRRARQAESWEACRGIDRPSVIQLRNIVRPCHAIPVVSVIRRPRGIEPPAFASEYCRRAHCTYRADRRRSRPPHQLPDGALDTRPNHARSRRSGRLLGIYWSNRCAPLAGHETAACRGSGHNYSSRLCHRFPGNWIRVVATQRRPERFSYKPLHDPGRGWLGALGPGSRSR
jgi:hypothetical protein